MVRDYPDRHIFTKEDINHILDGIVGKTLGEVDAKGVFARHADRPKVTGIAGMVIEQSVLGYEADNKQECDLMVDGICVELKTTGIKESKPGIFIAKEPMSITAVSLGTIVGEEFLESHFWEKLEHMLLVFYLYDSDSTVDAQEYARFPIKGFTFHEFSDADREVLSNEWTMVRDFIRRLQEEYEFPEDEYPRLSSELRSSLMMIDTAPKWPNNPRFRLKRVVVSNMVQDYFSKVSGKGLPESFNSYAALDRRCDELTEMYGGMTVSELLVHFDIRGMMSKSINERIVVAMFGGNAGRISEINDFRKIGLHGKTLVMRSTGQKKEDMKLFPVDFDELTAPDATFEESELYSYFREHQFLCIIFEETVKGDPASNKFVGFERISFDDEFIEKEVRRTWSETRILVMEGRLVETAVCNMGGALIINKVGTVRTKLNFPKSKDHKVFIRGGSVNSTYKSEVVNGIRIMKQFYWIQGKYIVDAVIKARARRSIQ